MIYNRIGAETACSYPQGEVNMKAAIYCRLSEEDRNKQANTDDSESIQNQKAMLKAYADTQGWEVFDVYSDDDWAGADRRRPEFNRLLQDAESRRFDVILCKTQSRFTRELELVEKYIHGLFPLWGIRFVSIVDNADTANKGNKKSRQINGLVNEWYLEDMSDNIKSVLTNRRINGYHIGSFALYGYKKDPDKKGHLLIDDEAADVVREVFTLFSQGYGKTAIARMLNDRGIPNPTEYKRRKGLRYKPSKNKNSTFWRYFSIADMLKNEIYIGNMVQGKYGSISYKTKQNKPRPESEWFRVEGTHEPIIDQGLWESVQSRIGERTKPCCDGRIGLFAKKVRCQSCGYSMRSTKNHGRKYLQCTNRYFSKETCEGAFISAEKLEKIVLDELNRLAEEYLDKDELERSIEFSNDLQSRKRSIEKDILVYDRKIGEYSKGIRDLYMDKVKGLITDSDYAQMSKTFTSERTRVEKARADCEKSLEELTLKMQAGDNRREIIERYTRLEHLSREMVEVLIDYISVGKRIDGTHDVPIEIHWNF